MRRSASLSSHLPLRQRLVALAAGLLLLLPGCLVNPWAKPSPKPSNIQLVQFLDPVVPTISAEPIALRGGRNETVSFAVQISGVEQWVYQRGNLRIGGLTSREDAAGIPAGNISAWQVLPMPVEANRAGFIRHTGLGAGAREFPRALIGLKMRDGAIELSSLRNTDQRPPLIWVDVQIPPTAAAVTFQGACDLRSGGSTISTLPMQLKVEEFVIPDERHLQMIGSLEWSALQRLYPDAFKGIQPHLLSRSEPRHAAAIAILDQIVKLAQSHRAGVIVPRLAPGVKWPPGQPPQIDWADFDGIIAPWMKGSAFADGVGLGFWPLPGAHQIAAVDARSQADYWQAAASHFGSMDWLSRSAIVLSPAGSGRIGLTEGADICERAAKLLAGHDRVRVMVPLKEDQVQLAAPRMPNWIKPEDIVRLLYAAPTLISTEPLQRLPEGQGVRWIHVGDSPGQPYAGAGTDEREVRLWAWLAFLREATLVEWPAIAPRESQAADPADPGEVAWLYPGEWFGLNEPVPTLQLKWLRRAQQDYEYLFLALQRGQLTRAKSLARLICKPIDLRTAQSADPAYSLLSGTSDPKAWAQLSDLLTRTVLLSQPGQSIDPQAERQLSFDILAWSDTQQRPLLMPRSAQWTQGVIDRDGTPWLNLKLGIDIYNAAERPPQTSKLQWTSAPEAWRVGKDATDVPKLTTYSISHFLLDAQIAEDKISPATRKASVVSFVDGNTNKPYNIEAMLPAAWCEHRQGAPPRIDGSLGDWAADDALHEGKLVALQSRPGVQHQELTYAPVDSAIYSTYTNTSLYIAFKLNGADATFSNAETSFVNYEFRRAWGEDVCEILIQPVYANGATGPLLHVALKPRGQLEISRRLNPKLTAFPWQAFAGSDIRYASNIDKTIWRGEIAIPWEAINAPEDRGKKPVLLRFNFTQHYGATGQSASWAGPIDHGRDEDLMGVLDIRGK